MMDLNDAGWDGFFDRAFGEYSGRGLAPARVICEHRERYEVLGTGGIRSARVSGRLIHTAGSRADFPAVGDWVCIDAVSTVGDTIIRALLPRKSKFSRKVAGAETDEQVVASNIDTVFLVSAFGGDSNPRRVERYVTLAWESGASPVIVLNKADLCDDRAAAIRDIEDVAVSIPVLVVSALTGQGLEGILEYLKPGSTGAFLGSSGVGKSTIINGLIGATVLKAGEVRPKDGKGRHVTTVRQLVKLPSGGMIIDTPGMREIQLWAGGEGLEESFDDIERIARECRFRDCGHGSEPGCAVKEAIEEGRLDPRRLKSYFKLQRELESLAVRKDQRARLHEKSKWKKIAKWSRERNKYDPKRMFRDT
jgi:ribosome biogenesis GTPase